VLEIRRAALSQKLSVIGRRRRRRTFRLSVVVDAAAAAELVDGRLHPQEILQDLGADFGRRPRQDDETAVVDGGHRLAQVHRWVLLRRVALSPDQHHVQIPTVLAQNGTQNVFDQLGGFRLDADRLFRGELEPEQDPRLHPDFGAAEGGAVVGLVAKF